MIHALICAALFYLLVFLMAREREAQARERVLGVAGGVGVLTFIVLRAVPGLQGLLLSFPAIACLSFFGLSLGCGVENRRALLITAAFIALDVVLWFVLNLVIAASVH